MLIYFKAAEKAAEQLKSIIIDYFNSDAKILFLKLGKIMKIPNLL